MPHTVPPPRDLADARAVLTDPARHRCLPAVIETHWAFLAEARGMRLDLGVLQPAHLTRDGMIAQGIVPPGHCWTPHGILPIDTPAPAATIPAAAAEAPANPVDAARLGAIPAIRAAIVRAFARPAPGHVPGDAA